MAISIDFTAEPTAVVDYLKSKDLALTFNYDEMIHDAHHRAFTVAKITNLDLLGDIQNSLVSAFKEGKPFERWKSELTPTLKKYGWYGLTNVTNPKTGEIKEIYVGSRRLKTIFDTNMRVAYAQARYKSQMESDCEYLRYVAILDGKTRPAHRALHGTILPKTDPFWNKNYPPNSWHCRCRGQGLTKYDVARNGYSVNPTAPAGVADSDWAYNPGDSDKTLTPNMELGGIDGLQNASAWQSLSAPLVNDISRTNCQDLPKTVFDEKELLPKGLSDTEYINTFLNNFGADIKNPAYFKDAIGDMMVMSDELFKDKKLDQYKVQKNGREQYLQLLADTIKDPLEIWLDVVTNGKKVKIKKRYLKIYTNQNGDVAGFLAFDLVNNTWSGTTAFNPAKGENVVDWAEIEKIRQGVKVYEKSK